MAIALSADLHMSYKVSAATETAVNASISTPVLATTVTLASIRTRSGGTTCKSTEIASMGSG